MPLWCEDWLIQLATSCLGTCEPKILQPFAGSAKYGLKIDLRASINPDIIADAHSLPLRPSLFDIVLCDPPYSDEESRLKYGTPPLRFRRWSREAERVLDAGGVLILYHKVMLPNPDPSKLSLIKRVFIGNRTWHALRVALLFQKEKDEIA